MSGRRHLDVMLSLIFALLVAAIAAWADRPTAATRADLERLQGQLERLDDSLATLDREAPGSRALQARADRIRDDVVSLRDSIQRQERDESGRLAVSRDEVDRLGDEIAELRKDIGASGKREAYDREITIPEGTSLVVRLQDEVSSRTARPEDRVEATLSRSIRVDTGVAVPQGARVVGHIRDVEQADRALKGAKLDLTFDTLILDDGTRVSVPARVVSLDEGIDKRETAKNTGLGALLGGVVGGLAGGRKGALVGVLVGGAGGAIVSKGEDVRLPAGTVLTLRLDRPVTVARR
jgi:hypothetical protein